MKTRMAMLAMAAWAVLVPAWGKSFTLDLRNHGAAGARRSLAMAGTSKADGMLRTFALDAGMADVGEVAVGDILTFVLFDDVTLSLTLKEKMPSPLGGDVFIAEADGYEGVKNAVVLRTADGLVADVQDYLRKKVYKVISAADGVTVQEIEAKGGGTCGCDALKTSHSAGAAKSVRRLASGAGGDADTYVDILVAYEQNAVTWVKSYGGGVTNFAHTAVQKMNTALANVGLDSSFRFRLVGVLEVSSSSRSLEYALDYATSGTRGWGAVKAKRDEVGADIVTVLVDTGSAYGVTGLSWSLESDNFDDFADSAYNACSIRAVAQDHTMTHEVGHNMGCGHSDAQETQPGPQLYGYSSGYYFSAEGEKFHTIMAYDGEGGGGSAVPYFSSPDHTYRGVAVGDATHDNTKTLANTFAVAAGWRDSSAEEISGGDEQGEEFFYDNDDFSNAKELVGTSGRISGSTVDAIGDISEFLAQKYMSRHTVWYKWKAPSDGQFLVDVEKADFDTVMAAFSGSSSGSLTTLAHNDDKSKNDSLSAVSFDVKKDETYHICVGGYQVERGDFRLKWELKGFSMVFAAVAADCEGMGTVTGGGKSFKPGTKVTLKATPSGDNVFAEWTSDSTGIEWDLTLQNLVFVMSTNDVTVTARFATAQEDAASLKLEVSDMATDADGAFTLDLGACVTSISTPKISVSGLPSGLKYNSKTMTILGKATKPGVYTVNATATNASVTGKDAVVKEFTITVPNLTCEALPNLEPAATAYGIVQCGVAFNSSLVDCSAKDGWTVKVTGLPAGIKYDAKKGVIAGIPTKAGDFTVTFTASKKGEKSQIATITLVTAALPAWAQGTFSGYVKAYDGEPGYGDRYGSATMTVSSNGKVSGKITLDGTNWTFSATSFSRVELVERVEGGVVTNFAVEAEAKAGKATMPVKLAARSASGPYQGATLVNGTVDGTFGEMEVQMWRNVWKDKETAAEAKAEIAKWEGTYTISTDDGGYLSLKIGAKGDVAASGKLADGTSVTAKTTLMHDEDAGWFVPLHAAPSAYKGGALSLAVGFEDGEGGIAAQGVGARLVGRLGIARWTNRNPQATGEYGAGFDRTVEFIGAYYDKTKNLNDFFTTLSFTAASPALNGKTPMNGDAVEVSFDGKGKPTIAKDSGLTLSFAQATGIFKGGYTFIFDAKTKKKVSFEGILVQGLESLTGFYLWDVTSSYVAPETQKAKTYRYKESYPVVFDSAYGE